MAIHGNNIKYHPMRTYSIDEIVTILKERGKEDITYGKVRHNPVFKELSVRNCLRGEYIERLC